MHKNLVNTSINVKFLFIHAVSYEITVNRIIKNIFETIVINNETADKITVFVIIFSNL